MTYTWGRDAEERGRLRNVHTEGRLARRQEGRFDSFEDQYEKTTVEEEVMVQQIQDCPHDIQTQTLKIKVLEEVKSQTGIHIDSHLAPIPVRDLVESMTTKFTSSFFVVNIGTVVDKYLLWKHSMPRVMPFYAVKSNPDEIICRTLHTLGSGFDCASKAEIKQALELGCSPQNIIFANPCKSVQNILYAKEKDVAMMTFDNIYELIKISNIYPEAKLVLRILPDDSHSLMPFGSKFGASFKDSVTLIEKCVELGMDLIGVSFHVGSGCYSSIAWVEALKLARAVFDEAEKRGYEMTLLDIGGGWPGTESGALRVAELGKDISPVIDELFSADVRVISEPGRYFCSETTTLATTIISKRHRVISGAGSSELEEETESQLYISDGVYGSFNCIIFDHYKPEPKLLSEDAFMRPVKKSTMFGPTCDSMDCIVKGYEFPEAEVGEWVYFENMGAYTMAAGSTFNGMPLPEVEYIMIATPFVAP